MTVSSTPSRNQYIATAGQTIFPYAFEIFSAGDLVVEINGITQSEGTNYTILGVGVDTGGSITLTSGATAGDIVTVYRDMELNRLNDYQQSGDFLAEEVNDDFDRLWLAIQQIEDSAGRSIRASTSDTVLNSTNTLIPSVEQRAGRTLGFDTQGVPTYYSAAVPVGDFKVFDNVEAMKADTNLQLNDVALCRRYYSGGELVEGLVYEVVASGTGTEDGGSFHNLVNGNQAKLISEKPSLKVFGAVSDNSNVDNFPFIQNLTSYLRTVQDFPVLDFEGFLYYGQSPLSFDFNIKICNGVYQYNGNGNNLAILSIGNFNGDSLVRGSIIEGFRVKIGIDTINTNITGFRLQGLVRSTIIRDSYAEMFGDLEGLKNHIGFELLANRLAVSTSAGLYQNSIQNCTALFANTGFKISTAGTESEARLDPQANGNYLDNCFAFSCRQKALHVGFGAQENYCNVRADTFPSQIGLGTRIDVADIEGSYNSVHLVEEIGVRADTQYSIRLGEFAVYNKIEASTQQIVSGFIDDSSSPTGKRQKNIISQLGAALISKQKGGEEVSHCHFQQISDSQTNIQLSRWIAPAKCVVTKVQGMLTGAAPVGGSTFLYFAKNSLFQTNNRLTWASGEAVNIKEINTDPSASIDIGSQWCLEKGDFLSLAATTPAGGGTTGVWTVFIKFV